MKYKSISENAPNPQVVGGDFKAGAKHLAEIRKHLKLKKAEAPDYLGHHAAAAEAMVALGKLPYVRALPSGQFVCSFEHGGLLVVTAPQESAPAAVTCALHFTLTNQSAVT